MSAEHSVEGACHELGDDGHHIPRYHLVCAGCHDPGQTECTWVHDSPPNGLGSGASVLVPHAAPAGATDLAQTTTTSAITHPVNLQNTMGKAVTAALGRDNDDGNHPTS